MISMEKISGFLPPVLRCLPWYNNKKYNDALKAQIDKLIHTSIIINNVPAIEAAGS